METRKVPNFLIVGAAKSGTTSLYHYIKKHPMIYMPKAKEPMFFVSEVYTKISRKDPRHQIADKFVISDYEKYLDLFNAATPEQELRGEASAAYLFHHNTAIPNIKKHLGDIKIIIILRNPIERAYSSYAHLVRDGVEFNTFEKFLNEEETRLEENWDIINFPKSVGLYHDQVKAYKDAFSHIKVLLLDDLIKNPTEVLNEVYSFLGVDLLNESHHQPVTTKVFNESSIPKSWILHHLLVKQPPAIQLAKSIASLVISKKHLSKLKRGIHKKNQTKKKLIKSDTKKQLEQFFKEDMLKTQKLINRDLSFWFKN